MKCRCTTDLSCQTKPGLRLSDLTRAVKAKMDVPEVGLVKKCVDLCSSSLRIRDTVQRKEDEVLISEDGRSFVSRGPESSVVPELVDKTHPSVFGAQ